MYEGGSRYRLPLFLIGYMGAGKTTLGEALSKQLHLRFIDLDNYIEVRFHKSIPKLFEEKGEDGFRRMEYNMLHEVGEFEDVLISVGGGTPCFFDNMEYMNSCGVTLYLKVTADELARRLEHNTYARPVLQGYAGEELRHFIAKTLTQREPFYSRSQLILDAAQMDTADQIRQLVEQFTNKMHII